MQGCFEINGFEQPAVMSAMVSHSGSPRPILRLYNCFSIRFKRQNRFETPQKSANRELVACVKPRIR